MIIIFFCLDFYKLIPKQIWKYKYHKNCFRKVISFNKSDGHFQLAVVKTHSGDLSGAKDELNKARELDYDENGIDYMYAVIDEIIEIGYDEHIDRNKL